MEDWVDKDKILMAFIDKGVSSFPFINLCHLTGLPKSRCFALCEELDRQGFCQINYYDNDPGQEKPLIFLRPSGVNLISHKGGFTKEKLDADAKESKERLFKEKDLRIRERTFYVAVVSAFFGFITLVILGLRLYNDTISKASTKLVASPKPQIHNPIGIPHKNPVKSSLTTTSSLSAIKKPTTSKSKP